MAGSERAARFTIRSPGAFFSGLDLGDGLFVRVKSSVNREALRLTALRWLWGRVQ